MRILCRHGHFAFYPRTVSDVAAFANRYDLSLSRVDEYYTFDSLAGAPEYSLPGLNYLGLPAVVSFAGKPWEVMKANGFVLDLNTKALVPKTSIVTLINPSRTGLYYTAETPLVQPGSRDVISALQVLSYDAELDMSSFTLRVREFKNV
jgi:hypothetical protein